MSRRLPAARGAPDANQAAIVADYEALGCTVVDTHALGFGFPDLVVGLVGRTELVEVKGEAGIVRPGQARFIRDWRGSKVVVVRTRADVVAHVTAIRQRVRATVLT